MRPCRHGWQTLRPVEQVRAVYSPQIGPAIRPRLINELLNPIVAPCRPVERFEASEITDVRNSVLDRMNKPVATKMVTEDIPTVACSVHNTRLHYLYDVV